MTENFSAVAETASTVLARPDGGLILICAAVLFMVFYSLKYANARAEQAFRIGAEALEVEKKNSDQLKKHSETLSSIETTLKQILVCLAEK